MIGLHQAPHINTERTHSGRVLEPRPLPTPSPPPTLPRSPCFRNHIFWQPRPPPPFLSSPPPKAQLFFQKNRKIIEKHDLEVLTKSRPKAATPLTFQYAEPSRVARTPFVCRVARLKTGRLLSSQK